MFYGSEKLLIGKNINRLRIDTRSPYSSHAGTNAEGKTKLS